MRELEVVIPSTFEVAGVLCLPEAAARPPVPAIALLGGSGADTRDGDLALEQFDRPVPGTLRQIAHDLAHHGIASLRWDRRGFGRSGGDSSAVGYDTDLEDAKACLDWLRSRPEVDPARMAVAGHSAGALIACRLCRDVPGIPAAALLGALSSPIEDMLARNAQRVTRHWGTFTDQQREWLVRKMPRALARVEGIGQLIEAARRGDETAVIEGYGVAVEMRTARLRHDLATSYADEMRHVRCPALVLHGGEDLNVPVADALCSYRVLREAGNDEVELVVIPGLEHYFCPVAGDRRLRVWERISQAALGRPMARQALDAISSWAVRTLAPC